MIWARVISRSCFCCMCTVSPILLFSTISLHWSLRKAFLSLLAILWNCAFKWVYLSSSPLPLTSPLFSAICKASCYFFAFLFLGDGFESSSKTSISAILTMPKHLTVWITKSVENSERDGNTRPPDLPLEESVCRSGSKSELDMKDWFQIGKGVC